MARPKLTPAESEKLKRDLARLRREDRTITYVRMADVLNARKDYAGLPQISAKMVEYYWNQIVEGWRAIREAELASHMDELLAEIKTVAAEAWAAWERSKEGTTVTERTQMDDGSERLKIYVRKEAGDPRYLAQVLQAAERASKLLGLDAPVRAEIGGPGGGPLQVVPFDYQAAITDVLTDTSDAIESEGYDG